MCINETTATGASRALATQNNSFLALASIDFTAMASDELSGLDLQFERIKMLGGGAGMFEIPGEGDSPETVKEFSAVILYHHVLNAYYSTKYTGGSNPPDCGSLDGIIGTGNPGGRCQSCAYNQFGTGDNGSKACKNKRRVYILREGEVFPLLLTLPTGSLKVFTKYVKTQLSKGRKTNAVVTRFGLKKVTNAGGIAYSQAVFSFDRELTPEEYTVIQPLSEQIKRYAAAIGFDSDPTVNDDEPYCDPETGEIIEPLGK